MIQHTPFFILPSKAELHPRNEKALHSGIFQINIPPSPGNRNIQQARKYLNQHSQEQVLTLLNIYVFFNVNKPWNRLLYQFGNSVLFMLVCFWSQPSCHVSLKIVGYSNLQNGDILKMSNLELSQPGV